MKLIFTVLDMTQMMGLTRCYKTAVFWNLRLQFFDQVMSYLFSHEFADSVPAVWLNFVWAPIYCVGMPNLNKTTPTLYEVVTLIFKIFKMATMEFPDSGMMTALCVNQISTRDMNPRLISTSDSVAWY